MSHGRFVEYSGPIQGLGFERSCMSALIRQACACQAPVRLSGARIPMGTEDARRARPRVSGRPFRVRRDHGRRPWCGRWSRFRCALRSWLPVANSPSDAGWHAGDRASGA